MRFYMLISILNLVLSPFCLLFFVFYASNKEQKYFVPDGTNVNKLKVLPYLIYGVVYVTVILFFTYLYTLFTNLGISVWEVYEPQYYWVSMITWGVTVLTLVTFF